MVRSAPLVILVSLMALRAAAQESPIPEAARRLTVTGPAAGPREESGLAMALSIFEAYDNAQLQGSSSTLSPSKDEDFRQTGGYTGANATVQYTRSVNRFSLGMNGHGSLAYYPFADRAVEAADVGTNLAVRIGQRSTLDASETFGYAPYYDFDLFPESGNTPIAATPPSGMPSTDFALLAAPTYRVAASTRFRHTLSARSSLSLSYGFQKTAVSNMAGNWAAQQIGGLLTHAVSRHLTLHGGYSFIADRYDSGVHLEMHDIDVGADYQRELSFSRRTTFAFSTGSAVMSNGIGAAPGSRPSASDEQGRVRLLGEANLTHHMGRTWAANVGYHRGWQMVEGFAEPFFLDSITIGTSGMLNGRASVGTSASYVLGSSGLSSKDGRHASYTGSGWLRIPVSRTLQLYSQYLYYGYVFSDLSLLPDRYPRRLGRNGVRIGLSIVFPRRP
jgi:hypothetical protein